MSIVMKSDANQNTSRVLMTFNVENWSILFNLSLFLKNYVFFTCSLSSSTNHNFNFTYRKVTLLAITDLSKRFWL